MLLVMVAVTYPQAAQGQDSTAVRKDTTIATATDTTLSIASDTISVSTPVESSQSIGIASLDSLWHSGDPLTPLLPARTFAFELPEILTDEPLSFLYDLGGYGWPHGWSPFGLSPQNIGLSWNGIPMTGLFTARAQYEMIPFGAAGRPTFARGTSARPGHVITRTRPYEEAGQPITELRYQSSNKGLQKMSGLHAQNRKLTLFGRAGVVNVLFWYRGEGAKGEYPGSRLRRGRQIYTRLKYVRPSWSLEVSELYTRQPLGAHGGVVPTTGDFNSIYQRLGATVVDPDARRRTIRNDLHVSLVLAPGKSGAAYTRITTALSRETFEFRRPGDTLEVKSTRYLGAITQGVRLANHQVSLDLAASLNRGRASSDTLGFDSVTDRRLLATASDVVRIGGATVRGMIGAEVRKEGTGIVAEAEFRYEAGRSLISLAAVQTPQVIALMDRSGFGSFMSPMSDIPLGTSRVVSGRLGTGFGPIDVAVLGSLVMQDTWKDYFETPAADSVAVRRADARLQLAAVGLDIGFRRDAKSGIYASFQPSAFGVLNANTSDLRRYDRSLPEAFVVGRIGARYLLFHGDLDLDFSIRGRSWIEFMGRSLHTPTGILALRSEAGRPVASSVALDVMVTAGVRTATLFVSYENLLSGTSAVPGNLLVPVYPLTEKRLRFGVYWPIMN